VKKMTHSKNKSLICYCFRHTQDWTYGYGS